MKKLNKKFLALTLSFVMLVMLAMPAMAFATTPPESIGVVDVNVAIPFIGDSVSDHKTVGIKQVSQIDDNYTVEWRSRQAGSTDEYVSMEDSDTFKAGYEYKIVVTVSPAEGYQFEESISWGRVNNTISDYSIIKTFEEASIKAEIGEANVKIERVDYTIAKPVAGQITTQLYASIKSEPEGCINYESSKGIGWMKRIAGSTDEYQAMGGNVVFDAGDYEYKVQIGALPAEGYGFTEDTEYYVNGQKVEIDRYDEDSNRMFFMVELKNYPTDADNKTDGQQTADTTVASAVKAGDSSDSMFYALLAVAAVSTCAVTLFVTKKNG